MPLNAPSDRNLTTSQSWALQRPKETLPWGKPPAAPHKGCTSSATLSKLSLQGLSGLSYWWELSQHLLWAQQSLFTHLDPPLCSQVHPLTIHGPIHPSAQPHASPYLCAHHPRIHHWSPQSPPPQLPPQPWPRRPASPQGSRAVRGGGSKPPVLSPPPILPASGSEPPVLSLPPILPVSPSPLTWFPSLHPRCILGHLEPRVDQQVWVCVAPRSHGPRLWAPVSLGSPCPPGPAAPALVQTPGSPGGGASVLRTAHARSVPRTRGALPSSSRAGGHLVPRRGFPLSALPMGKLRPGDGHGFLSAQGITCLEVCSLARMGCGG